MELRDIHGILQSRALGIDATIFDELRKLKNIAVMNNKEDLANEVWFYEAVAKTKSDFLRVYTLLKDDEYEKYYAVWCLLEEMEITFGNIRDNYPERLFEFDLSFIESTIFNLQRMFPYKLFFSREMVVKRSECSICHKETSIRHPCPHKVGKLYAGELCCTIVADAEIISENIVTEPFDKYCVPHMQGMQYNYIILQQLMKNWDNPYDQWYIEVSNILKPEYKNIGRNSPCPCGLGKKYKRCCLGTQNEKMEHFRLTFRNKTFAETPMEVSRTTVPTN